MGLELNEGALSFVFGDKMTVVKFDGSSYYRKRYCGGESNQPKGIDFTICSDQLFIMLEVKDYRGRDKRRVTTRELIDDFRQKVQHTLAGLVGACHTEASDADWKRLAHAMIHARPRIVLWLEEERQTNRANVHRMKNMRDTLQKSLSRRMRWLSTDVRLVWLDNYRDVLPDLIVTDMQEHSA